MERKMKKMFLLLFIALWQLICMAIELTEAEIMPKKLIFTELPEDYPAEMNDLFEFYYQTYKELYSRISDITSVHENYAIHESLINELSLDEIRRIIYWEWIAKIHIHDYWSEFIALHYWIHENMTNRNEESEFRPYADKIWRLLYYPKGLEQALEQNVFIFGIGSIRSSIFTRYNYETDESINVSFSFINYFVPIIGTLINVKSVSLSEEFVSEDTCTSDYGILELDTGGTIVTVIGYKSWMRLNDLVVGKKYLIPASRVGTSIRPLHRAFNIPLTSYYSAKQFLIEDDIIKVEKFGFFEHFFNVNKLNNNELQYFDTPVDVFWERYNNFHKLILGGK
jgi:hypothetical protein